MGNGHSLLATPQWLLEGRRSYGRAGFLRAAEAWKDRDLAYSMQGRVVLCTGANSGLGRFASEFLARRGAEVHMLCRDESRGEAARREIVAQTGNSNVHLHVVDVEHGASVRRFAESFNSSGRPVHCLINNAGAIPASHSITEDGLESAMACMAGGSFLLTALLLPALHRGNPGRVVNVSSGGMYTVKLDVDDLEMRGRSYDGTLAYALAKRAQVMLTEGWAARCRGNVNVVFHSMHPGWADTPGVRTSLPSFHERMKDDLRDTAQGADTVLWLAMAPEGGDPARSGLFWFDRAPVRTTMPMSFTDSSESDRHQMWQHFERCYALSVDDAVVRASTGAEASE